MLHVQKIHTKPALHIIMPPAKTSQYAVKISTSAPTPRNSPKRAARAGLVLNNRQQHTGKPIASGRVHNTSTTCQKTIQVKGALRVLLAPFSRHRLICKQAALKSSVVQANDSLPTQGSAAHAPTALSRHHRRIHTKYVLSTNSHAPEAKHIKLVQKHHPANVQPAKKIPTNLCFRTKRQAARCSQTARAGRCMQTLIQQSQSGFVLAAHPTRTSHRPRTAPLNASNSRHAKQGNMRAPIPRRLLSRAQTARKTRFSWHHHTARRAAQLSLPVLVGSTCQKQPMTTNNAHVCLVQATRFKICALIENLLASSNPTAHSASTPAPIHFLPNDRASVAWITPFSHWNRIKKWTAGQQISRHALMRARSI